jgi:hypothetical protein
LLRLLKSTATLLQASTTKSFASHLLDNLADNASESLPVQVSKLRGNGVDKTGNVQRLEDGAKCGGVVQKN